MSAVANRSAAVDRFLAALDHPLREGIVALRAAILAGNDAITERIKWNAPSFGVDGDDRVTFKLHPPDRLQLVVHRGAKARDMQGFTFADPSGLVRWVAPDRGVVTLRSLDEIAARTPALVGLVNAWIAATR